jgi:hypothetical protein
MASHTMPWLGSMFFLVHTIIISHQNLPLLFALPNFWHKRLVWHPKFLALGIGFRKICLTRNKKDWDLALPYITMGYRMSKHASLSHVAPYFLLFWRHPIPSSSIVAQMDQVVNLDSLTTWARVIAKRVILFKKVMPMAMENLSIARHRDTLQYAHTRGGSYKPKVRQFDVRDFVYF